MTWTKRSWFLLGLAAVVVAGVAVVPLRSRPQPQYCWLAFGPEAKIRLLVSLQGEEVRLDEFLNGEPTGRKESFGDRSECKDFTVSDPSGSITYVITGMSGTIARAGVPTELFVDVHIQGPLEYRQYCDAMMSCDLSEAPIAHFHGPLVVAVQTTNGELPPGLALRRGDTPTDLRAFVGTINAEEGCWVVVASQDKNKQPLFPQGTHPYVDVEFPAKDQNAPPIRKRYPLDRLCCGCVFHGAVSVPNEAGNGMAKLRFSFDTWKAAKIGPSTTDLPVLGPVDEKKGMTE